MEIKAVYWKDRKGNSLQEDDSEAIRNEHVMKGGKSFIAGLICGPYGWDVEYGDTILSLYRKEISSTGSFLGWEKMKGEELKKKYLFPLLAPENDIFFQDTHMVVTYEDENIYIREYNKQFIEGLKWFSKTVDRNIEYKTTQELKNSVY
jgi:hypothetical protein